MNNDKQSSVEWLYQEFERIDKEFHVGSHEYNYAKNLALKISKAMHKEEIENAFVECWKANMPDGYECKLSAKEYYNETYESNS